MPRKMEAIPPCPLVAYFVEPRLPLKSGSVLETMERPAGDESTYM